MKNNYPIKYSVIGIYDEINRNTNEPEQITYIASKCYVVEENIIHNENGTKKKTYGVYFPFVSFTFKMYVHVFVSFVSNFFWYHGY